MIHQKGFLVRKFDILLKGTSFDNIGKVLLFRDTVPPLYVAEVLKSIINVSRNLLIKGK